MMAWATPCRAGLTKTEAAGPALLPNPAKISRRDLDELLGVGGNFQSLECFCTVLYWSCSQQGTPCIGEMYCLCDTLYLSNLVFTDMSEVISLCPCDIAIVIPTLDFTVPIILQVCRIAFSL